MWKPIPLEELQNLILDCEIDIEGCELDSFWKFIKITPIKWKNEPMGDEGGGFWVVGIFGQHVLWYNDIEEGFNISAYSTVGVIDDYNCSQADLKSLLISIRNGLTVIPVPII